LGFYTSSFNRYFHSIARRLTSIWKLWFNTGVVVALITSFCATLTLIVLPFRTFRQFSQRSTTHRDELTLQPLIPGVNLPIEQLGHFLCALIVSTVFHEIGHAIAAATEHVRINGCGGFVYFVYPGAYVDLNEEQIEMLSRFQQLRIFCAGIFHNIVLVFLSFVILLVHPVFLRTFYIEVANVHHVAQNSPLSHLLPLNTRISSIDDCQVKTGADWIECLRSIQRRHPLETPGFCLSSTQIEVLSTRLQSNQNTSFDCCENQSSKNYCFLYQTSSNERNGVCAEVRKLLDFPSCFATSDCSKIDRSVCLQPFSSDNQTRLIQIGHSEGPKVLFVGSIEELARTVSIQSFQSTSFFFPNFFVTDFPLFIQYVAAISFALAFFNAIPCHAFDGQFILSSVVENPSRSILFIGSTLVIGNIGLALISFFFLSS